jgi:putative tryptophan/tyrosine transport system substrate-binding protein
MNKREFITLLGGAAAWPIAAKAQRRERIRRIGVLMNLGADDAEGQARLAAFHQGLAELGWIVGGNSQIDLRWGGADTELFRKYAAELVALAPDVLVSSGGPITQAMQRATQTIPIVFSSAIDPVGGGIVESLARPGRNATGFMAFEFSLGGKWLELLKQIAPATRRVAVLRDPSNPSGIGLFATIQAVAPSLGVEARPTDVYNANEIERGITAFAAGTNGGLIATRNAPVVAHRKLVIALAARHRLPAVYGLRSFVRDGGLIAYGPDPLDAYRRSADYVDRILKGAKPADLPVQAPVKYESAINLQTAKALGLTVPDNLLAIADEVIEYGGALYVAVGTKQARAYATDVRSWWKLTYKHSGGIRVLTQLGSELCIAAFETMLIFTEGNGQCVALNAPDTIRLRRAPPQHL